MQDVVGNPIYVGSVVSIPISEDQIGVAIVKRIFSSGKVDCRVIDLDHINKGWIETFSHPSEQLALLQVELDSTIELHRHIIQERS